QTGNVRAARATVEVELGEEAAARGGDRLLGLRERGARGGEGRAGLERVRDDLVERSGAEELPPLRRDLLGEVEALRGSARRGSQLRRHRLRRVAGRRRRLRP